MVAISFKTHEPKCFNKFFVKFQCNQTVTFRVKKNYIIVAATISSEERSVFQTYGAAYRYEIRMIACSKLNEN